MRARFAIACTVLITIAVLVRVSVSAEQSASKAPFIVTASTGPAAGAHVTATVSRVVAGRIVTLPAALVPALQSGDVVDVDFPDYRRPPSTVNYHVNVAFITEIARQQWLFERSTRADQLFTNARGKAAPSPTRTGRIHFVYGAGGDRGIPIFFIIPEDAKTRGVDGVRDYVGAHPTDFVDMSESTNDAVAEYSYLQDFLSSLGSGSIDPASEQDRIETFAQSFGVSPATIDECYVTGGSSAAVQNCVQQAVNSVVYQTNFSAPTQAQFLGGVVGAASPTAYAPYIASLLTVWRLFVHMGHQEYEYLPTTLALADPAANRGDELLMGLKIPTIRPPAATSDVLFFTIGDPKATEHAPVVVNTAPVNGVCERSDRVSIPLHFDHTSPYVHDAAISVTPDAQKPYAIPIDPRSLDAPVLDRSSFHGDVDGAYTIALTGRFGFDAVRQSDRVVAHLAFPEGAPWSLTPLPHHPLVAGEALDVIASSAAVPCLSRAEFQSGNSAPVPLTATQLDARRVELRGSLSKVPAGPAVVRLYQADPNGGPDIEAASKLALARPPAQVNIKSAVFAMGDPFVDLSGSDLDRVSGLVVNGLRFEKETGSSATSACFDGPALSADGLVIGQRVTAQLITDDNRPGELFSLTVAAPRPVLAPVASDAPAAEHLSTDSLTLTLRSAGGPLPRQFAVNVRQSVTGTPCADLRPDPTSVAVPMTVVHARSANTLSVEFRADVLKDRAFGTLEMQLVDAATGTGSNWQPLPGTFARAPEVSQITCPADPSASCELYGSELSAIEAVQDMSGAFVPPGLSCPATAKGVACVYVPHASQYTLRLVDGGTFETLPDAMLTQLK